MLRFTIDLCDEDIETLKSDDYESQDSLLAEIKEEIMSQFKRMKGVRNETN